MDASDLLDDGARATIDHALALTPPLHSTVTDAELGLYTSQVAAALSAFAPWKDAVVDQLEVVTLLRVLTRVHEVHTFRIDEDDGNPPLMHTLRTLRQSRDSLVASLACTLFARLCSVDRRVMADPRTERWRSEVWC